MRAFLCAFTRVDRPSMSEFDEHQRRRWMRENAHLYVRHDAHRYMAPGSPIYVGKDVVKYCWPEPDADRQAQEDERKYAVELEAARADLLRLKADLVTLRAEIKFQRRLRDDKAYNPNQPRVPAGNPDGGQWTSEGGSGSNGVRLAASDKPRFGPATVAAIALDAAKKIIDAYRNDNLLRGFFGPSRDTVTFTELDGQNIFGSNSTSPTYTSRDRAAANALRDTVVEKYPDVMNTDQIGRRPNDAIYHAETTALLRAARANGGTLAGRSLEIYSDRFLCQSCDTVLPHVGLELGNPTVTFVAPNGRRRTMRNGAWAD